MYNETTETYTFNAQLYYAEYYLHDIKKDMRRQLIQLVVITNNCDWCSNINAALECPNVQLVERNGKKATLLIDGNKVEVLERRQGEWGEILQVLPY